MKKYEKLQYWTIIALLTVCSYRSYQDVLFPNYADELLLILIFVITVVFKLSRYNNVINKVFLWCTMCILSYSFLGLVSGFIHGSDGYASLMDLVESLKVPIVFIVIGICDINEYIYQKLMKMFVIMNIPSMICGLIQYYNATVKGIYWGNSIYRLRNGSVRISGFGGHEIFFGYTNAIIIIFLLKIKNKKKYHYILLAVSAFCLYHTQSRYPIFSLLAYIIIRYVFINAKSNYRVLLFTITWISLITAVSLILLNINRIFLGDETHTIRIGTITLAKQTIWNYPLFGTGLGSFGTLASVEYSSWVYRKFSYPYVSSLLRGASAEAEFFQFVIKSGIVGTFIYFLPFLRFIRDSYRSKEWTVMILISFFIIINSFFNNMYQLPLVYVLAIYISHMYQCSFNNKKNSSCEPIFKES